MQHHKPSIRPNLTLSYLLLEIPLNEIQLTSSTSAAPLFCDVLHEGVEWPIAGLSACLHSLATIGRKLTLREGWGGGQGGDSVSAHHTGNHRGEDLP